MTLCKQCQHLKWKQLTPHGANWLLCGCTKRHLVFGLESDVKRNTGDKDRGIAAMPKDCKDYEAIRKD